MTLAVTEKPNVDSHTRNVCWWVEVQASDGAAARAFWGELMGWTFENVMPEGQGEYWMAYRGGCVVGAMSQLREEDKAQGMPPHVGTYFLVDDADAIAAKVEAAGGTVLAPAFDVFESGRMAVLQDPQGGMFCVWQPKEFTGAELVNVPGALVWNEVITSDVEAAKAFYSAVFGWTWDTNEQAGDGYWMWTPPGTDRMGGGLMAKTPEMGDIPTVWNVTFGIDDTDAAIEKVTAAGGTLQMGPRDLPWGRYAQVADAQGISFGLMQVAPG